MQEKIPVLDHGFVRYIGHMGSDLSISRNARVSYDAEWRAGEDEKSDAKLIRYLMNNGHNTPFEAVAVTFEVMAPIFVLRQWHRHRTQCLAGDTKIKFARPSDGKAYWKTIKELADQWHTPIVPVKRSDKQKRTRQQFNRDRIQSMQLYCIENSESIAITKVTDVIISGEKEVFKITSKCGNVIKASKDHKFLTTEGWKTLESLVIGDNILSIGKVAPNKNNIKTPEYTEVEITGEVWKDTPYGDLQVSNLGRIKKHNCVVEPTVNSNNRAVVSVREGTNKWSTKQVSRLVAEHFIEGSGLVLHIDDNPLNNRISNLKFGTDKDNHNDAKTNGRRAVNGVTSVEIKSIESCGTEKTYDLEVEHKDHNFIANNFCTHNSYNELSARYRELPEIYYVPDQQQITTQAKDNKQMRTEEENLNSRKIQKIIDYQNRTAFEAYKELLALECPREIARSVLPVGTYSHMFTTANLHNWFRFLAERLHPHAQYEIRVYAEAILTCLREVAPVATNAFEEKYLNG